LIRKKKSKVKEAMKERSISPIIGVVLMVAITVTLAALVATFFFSAPFYQVTTHKIEVEHYSGDWYRFRAEVRDFAGNATDYLFEQVKVYAVQNNLTVEEIVPVYLSSSESIAFVKFSD